MLSPDSRAKSCPLSGRSSTYRPVQILEAGSNNTAFNNQIDPFNNACCRPQIDVNNGDNNVIINNIAYGIPATTAEDPRCEGTQPCTIMFVAAFLGGNGGGGTDNNNVWQNNLSFST